MRMSHLLRVSFSILVSVLCFACVARGQSEAATVSGLVTDSSGATVPKADVQLQSVDRGTVATATTNNAGIYVFSIVQPGPYQITVRKAGFKQVDLLGIIVNTQDHIEQNFRLQLGSVSESVTVSAETTNINTTDATVSTTIDRNFVENLPLNGRSFQTLILLSPGTVLTPVTSVGNGGTFSVNGQRANANSFEVDGVSANLGGWMQQSSGLSTFNGADPSLTMAGTTQGMVAVDALQEFKIQTSTYAPEFGGQPGGQVSLLTRSGANDFHGTAFDYLRNNDLDADNWFNVEQGLPKGVERQNDFGGTIGGPIFKDKTFFFFSYEGLRLFQPQTENQTVPSLSLRQEAAPAYQALLNSYPLPNPNGNGNTYTLSQSYPTNLDSYSVKIDQALGNGLHLFGRLSDTPSYQTQPYTQDSSITTKVVARALTLGIDIAVRPSLVNELRLNYGVSVSTEAYGLVTFGGAQPYNPSLLYPAPLVYGSTDFAQWLLNLPGIGSWFTTVGRQGKFSQRQINVIDNVSRPMGAHQFKWGLNYRRFFPIYSFAPLQASYIVTSISDLMAGNVSRAFTRSNLTVHPIYTTFSLYAQDTWRASSRLSLTYGLRWEINPPPGERDGLQPFNLIGLNDLATATLAPLNSKLYKTTYNNFAPRIGLAYQIRQSPGHETVVRGGFGVFYDLNSETTAVGFGLPPFNNMSPSLTGLIFPIANNVLPVPVVPAPVSPPFNTIAAVEPNLKLPYTLQWNGSVEQALGRSQSLTISYVASAGYRLLRSDSLFDFSPDFTDVATVRNASSSSYQSLQVQFNRRLFRGLQALASYTYSHSIDNASSAEASLSTLPAGDSFVDPNVDRGNSDFDLRNAFRAAASYNLPAWNNNFVSKAILGGWSFEAIGIAQSGLPVDLTGGNYCFDVACNGYGPLRPNVVPGQAFYLYGPECAAANNGIKCPGGMGFNPNAFVPVPTDLNGNPILNPGKFNGTLGRNVMRGFGTWQMDFALHRQFNLTERVNLQFRGEFFNIFNHTNFGNIDNNVPDGPGAFGLAQSTLNQSYGGLNQLYQIGGPRSIQLALKLAF
jgi:hypothetical protein